MPIEAVPATGEITINLVNLWAWLGGSTGMLALGGGGAYLLKRRRNGNSKNSRLDSIPELNAIMREFVIEMKEFTGQVRQAHTEQANILQSQHQALQTQGQVLGEQTRALQEQGRTLAILCDRVSRGS